MSQQYSRVELKVPDDLLDEIDRSASRAGLSRAAWIKEACRLYVRLLVHPSFLRYVEQELKRSE